MLYFDLKSDTVQLYIELKFVKERQEIRPLGHSVSDQPMVCESPLRF